MVKRVAGLVTGLTLVSVPLFAQDYIDLEAERRSRQNSEPVYEEPVDGIGRGSAQAPGNYSSASVPSSDAPAGSQPLGAGSSAGELFYQLQLLQQEVMELRGKVEEQDYQLRQFRGQSLERYLDLDRRFKELGASGGSGSTETGSSGGTSAPARELAGEIDAYRSAYGMVRSQQFSEAVTAFRQFLVDFPDGKYAANAHYWLGELYLVIVPPDDESARREFNLLLERYPDNIKIPDALYKLGKIYYDRGNRDRAREYLDRVVNEFGDSGSSAVKLARDFISRYY